MNAASNATPPPASGGSSPIQLILRAGLFIALLVGLYYLYKFLYGSQIGSAIDILSGPVSMTKTATDGQTNQNVVTATQITGIPDGGQYACSFWVYIADTKGFAGPTGTKLAHLLEISDNRFTSSGTKGKTLLFVGLNPMNGTLVVRQSTSDPTETIDNSLTAPSGSSYPLQSLIESYSIPGAVSQNDRCDIINGVEYQRWLLITVVGNGRTLDVYVDGKLARSCVYKGGFAIGSTGATGTAMFGVNNGGNLRGFLSKGRFYNYALTPDEIWALYQEGPTEGFSIKSFFSGLFSTVTSFGNKLDL
jgi:hypothetical protein